MMMLLHCISDLTRNCSVFDRQILGGGFENLFLNFFRLLSLQSFGHCCLQEETLRHSRRFSEYSLDEEEQKGEAAEEEEEEDEEEKEVAEGEVEDEVKEAVKEEIDCDDFDDDTKKEKVGGRGVTGETGIDGNGERQ